MSTDIPLLDSALLDCYGRFITLLPEDVLRDHIHLCFILQEAYWWYCDKWCAKHDDLPKMTLAQFIHLVCNDCPIIKPYVPQDDLPGLLSSWKVYSRGIPVRGAIILSRDLKRVLLVQSCNSKKWSFPRGKVDQDEDDMTCAAREVMEETGLSVGNCMHNSVYVQNTRNDGTNLPDASVDVKLYIVPCFDDSLKVCPVSKYEISGHAWIELDKLKAGNPGVSTYQVRPFVEKVIDFVRCFKRGRFKSQFPQQYAYYKRCFKGESSETRNTSQDQKNAPGESKSGKKVASDETVPYIVRGSKEIGTCGSIHALEEGENASSDYEGKIVPKMYRNFKSRKQHVSKLMDRQNNETFGENARWSPDEMFRINTEKFGVVSTYEGTFNL
ncbi:conserved hypothetical protein [Theileria equi strain WA]|uniref:Nudix hydrolase domain-containing protein n=1 Tax=Theileria equi strain WA TaxID=1537102 RepID=L1LA00_THEEQ|nr:conserved hypothetical protein [Theileria equi strain WA]EKX71993.1 conserved hypothetical protein [Theileria equi strain WA]|eukprot:XP_004831445.1 conserved hypothetical protein [Theileria equi strain WA]